MQSRLKIPLLFAQDVIHGYKTTFPIPLGEAATWDLDAMELSARIAATEALQAEFIGHLHRWWTLGAIRAGDV